MSALTRRRESVSPQALRGSVDHHLHRKHSGYGKGTGYGRRPCLVWYMAVDSTVLYMMPPWCEFLSYYTPVPINSHPPHHTTTPPTHHCIHCHTHTYTAHTLTVGCRGKHSDIQSEYESLVAAEELQYNPQQLAVVKELRALQDRLHGYHPHTPGFMDKVREF